MRKRYGSKRGKSRYGKRGVRGSRRKGNRIKRYGSSRGGIRLLYEMC